jgi:phosphatidylinositol-3-phosphatase
MKMRNKMAVLALFLTTLASAVFAAEGAVPKGIPHLDHVFLIMMENHSYSRL